MKCRALFLFLVVITASFTTSARANTIRYGYETIGGLKIFFREAGNPAKPAIVLLHGFPSSSHMYREVLRGLASEYHLIAPDYPGFGNSSAPSTDKFTYTFKNIADVMNAFLEKRGITKYALMIQDYGAPIGFHIATKHPERVTALINQNGNAYKEGFSEKRWGLANRYWKNKSAKLEKEIIAKVFSPKGFKWQYTHGTRNPETILPDNWNLDIKAMSRPGMERIRLDLFHDYQNNIKLYPEWQAYLREHQPPVLIVWGKNDEIFPEAGAAAFKRDVKNLDYNILNTGHFALEEDHPIIIEKMRAFMARQKP